MDNILVVIHAAFLLLFGIFLSAAFAGIKINRKTGMVLFAFCAASGAVQAVLFVLFSEEFVWKMYPFVSHFPFFFPSCNWIQEKNFNGNRFNLHGIYVLPACEMYRPYGERYFWKFSSGIYCKDNSHYTCFRVCVF